MSKDERTVVVSRAEQLWNVAHGAIFCTSPDSAARWCCSRACSRVVTMIPLVTLPIPASIETRVTPWNSIFVLILASSIFFSLRADRGCVLQRGGGVFSVRRQVVSDLRGVEIVHREFLRMLLAGNGVGNAAFNQSPINAAAATGPMILRTAEMLEDTGVATQIGFGKYIQNPEYLGIAGKINSVEARHVAAIRDIREASGIPAVGAAGTRFAGDDIVVPSGAFAGLNAKIEYADALARVSATNFLRTRPQVSSPPASKPGTPDFGPPNPTP